MNRRGNGQMSQIYEREAESNRRTLANTLGELHQRLTLGQLFDEVMTYGRGGGMTLARSFANAARQNPLPTLLIGTACLLLMSEKLGVTDRKANRQNRDDHHGADYGMAYRQADMEDGSGGDSLTDTIKEKAHAMGAGVSNTMERAREAASEAREKVSESIESAGQSMSDAMGQANSRAVGLFDRARERTTTLCQEQPLVVAGIGIAIGSMIGALLPTSRPEDRFMGETSDAWKLRAKKMAGEKIDSAKAAAGRMAEEIKSMAEREAPMAADLVRNLSGEGEPASPEVESPGSGMEGEIPQRM